MIEAFDQLINDTVAGYVRVSHALNSDVGHQAQIVEQLFMTQRDFLMSSVGTRSPSAGTGPLQVLNKPSSLDEIVSISNFSWSHLL